MGDMVRDGQEMSTTAAEPAEKGMLKRDLHAEHLAFALRSARVGVWEWDITTNEVLWSDGISELFGMRPGEFDGTYETYLTLLPDEDRQRVLDAIQHSLTTGEPYQVEHGIRSRSGGRWFSAWGKVFRDVDQRPLRMIGAVVDSTSLRASEQNLLESEERFRSFAEASFEGILFSRGGEILDANPTLHRLLGYGPGELQGVRLEALLSASTIDDIAEKRAIGFAGAYRFCVLHKDGSEVPVEARERAVTFRGLAAIVTALRDVSEEQRLALEHATLEGQLQQAQKMEALGQLAGGIAHDFNNILTVILGNLEVAIEELDPASQEGLLTSVLRDAELAAKRAERLISQLLAFGRRQLHRPQVLDLRESIQQMNGMLTRLIREDIHLRIVSDDEVPPVRIDEAQLQQVLLNLVVNARDSMPNGGCLIIEASGIQLPVDRPHLPERFAGPFASIRVMDGGHGMDQATLARIFEPFFTTKEPGAGTGLGLSMAYGIIEQAGGHIWVESHEQAGTMVEILLPSCEGQAVESRRAFTPVSVHPTQKGSGSVLVCEDDEAVRSLTCRILSAAGYRVIEADTGETALRLARSEPNVRILVTDVVMPVMNGKELSERMRVLHPNIRTLFCSGYATDILSDRGVLSEGVAFLAKPYTRATLLGRVHQMLAEGQSV